MRMPCQIQVCVFDSYYTRLARLQPEPLQEASRPLVSLILAPKIAFAQSLRSNKSRTGAFTYTPRITGGWPLEDLILADEYKKMRSELDVTLSKSTTTPLQRAQYEALKKMADGGNVAWFMPAVIPRGGMISAPKPDTGYVTVIGFQLVNAAFNRHFAPAGTHIHSMSLRADLW